jgi:hypothetical protein
VGSTQAVKMRTPQQSYPGSKVGLYGAFMADVEKLKRLSLADRDRLGGQLEQAYTRGASLASLAASHRTSAGRVRLILLERGVVLRHPGGSTRRPDPQRLERAQVIARDYAAGATLAQLGSTHRIAPATVRNLVLAAGGQMRARGVRTPRPDGPVGAGRTGTVTGSPGRRAV